MKALAQYLALEIAKPTMYKRLIADLSEIYRSKR